MLGDPPYYEPLCFALDKSRHHQEALLAKLNEVHAPDQAGPYWARACELDTRYCRKE